MAEVRGTVKHRDAEQQETITYQRCKKCRDGAVNDAGPEHDGRQWRVSPHLVTPLQDITPEKPASKNAPKGRNRGR